MQTGNQTYQRALNSVGESVNIRDLTAETRRVGAPFSCVSCGNELIPRLGEKRAHHFAHKHSVTCSRETYLHAMGKYLFVANYRERIAAGEPFYLEFQRRRICEHYKADLGVTCKGYRWDRFDLTKAFTTVEVEKGIKGVVADVLLSTDEGKTLLIEVAVSHDADRGKLAKQLKMVEISVATEKDLGLFTSDGLSERDDRVTAYNLKPQPARGNLCQGRCDKAVEGLIVYKSGKSRLFQDSIPEWISQISGRQVAYSQLLGQPVDSGELHYLSTGSWAGGTFKKAVRHAVFRDKAPAKHCYNCKYHRAASVEGTVFCKTYRRPVVNGNEAASCERYNRFWTLEEAERADEENADWIGR
jgi:hypothetical protein